MSCLPRQSDCCCCTSSSPCCNYISDSCNIRRNRSCSDCFPTRFIPDIQTRVRISKTKLPSLKPVVPRANGRRISVPKNGKRINFRNDSELINGSPNKQKCQCDPKQTKNNQNFQYQDLKKRMKVISEEAEHGAEDDSPFGSKTIQNSCADFLNIVHDTVLETVQSSVECVMRNYFMRTMEKMEMLCSQMMRSECLLSKMYLDILDKLSQQREKGIRQFKCLCQFIADTQKESSEERENNQRCNCPNCTCTEDSYVSLAREKAFLKGPHILSQNRRQCRPNRYSDTEAKSDPSLTNCTNSQPLLFKTQEISINEENRRGSNRSNGYADHCYFRNSENRRNSESFKPDATLKFNQQENRM